MKKKLFVLITMLVGVFFNVTAAEFATEKRVAILPFSVKGNFDALYAEVAQDNFTTELIKGGAYRVVERSQLDKAMKELKFQSGNDFDESSAMEVGKLAGAEIVAIGIVTALKNQIIVNIRGISVKTGIAEFAEREFIKTQDELLTVVEKIARKLSDTGTSGVPSYGTNNFSTPNYASPAPAMDFSISEEYGNVPLSHSDKKFLVKFFQQKWGIDPRDTYNVHYMYKRYMGAGIAMATVGGVVTLAGIIMTGVGGWCYDYEEYSDHHDDYYNPYGFEGLILLCVGIPMFLAVGLPLIAMSSWPFIIADKTKAVYTKVTGQKSFAQRASITGGYDRKNERLEIAFGYRF
jgi:TolB-like protein